MADGPGAYAVLMQWTREGLHLGGVVTISHRLFQVYSGPCVCASLT